jgi:hypothetical protein
MDDFVKIGRNVMELEVKQSLYILNSVIKNNLRNIKVKATLVPFRISSYSSLLNCAG